MRAMVFGADADKLIVQATVEDVRRYVRGAAVDVTQLEGMLCRRRQDGNLELMDASGNSVTIMPNGPAAPRPGANKTFCMHCGQKFPAWPEAQMNGRIRCVACGNWT